MNILGELRAPLELGSLMRSGVWRGDGVRRGDGERVLTIPGLLVGDETHWPLRSWLARLGYRPAAAGIRANVQCSEDLMVLLEAKLQRMADADGRRVHVIGQSRGGMLAHVLGVRRPDLVASVTTLASPISATLDDFHPLLRRSLMGLTRMGDLRRGLLNTACWAGAPGTPMPQTRRARAITGDGDTCCHGFWPDLAAPLPEGVRGTALYSRSDGVLAADGCVAPGYRAVEVRASHAGMATSREAYRVIAAALAADAPDRVAVPR